jgi:glycosyltransferase involved in cell wall biosynthesis
MDLKDIMDKLRETPAQTMVDSFKGLRRNRRRRHQSSRVSISIIIPAHNEEHYLKATLQSLRKQRFPGVEVIVVANGCTDGTENVARSRCDRLVVLSQKCLGVARNLGARMAKGDLLIFLDADTILKRNSLRIIADRFTPRCAAGTIRGAPDSDRLAYRMIYGLKNFMHRSSLHQGSSGVIICWRKHFIELGGFRESLEVRENSELIKRLKRFGRYRYIGRATAVTSMRRYDKRGVLPMIWMWIRLWFISLFKDLQHRKYETIR